MKKIVKTEGADYEISAQWDSWGEAIKVNLKIKARDWKKPSNLEKIIFTENGFPFIFNVFKILGYEEEWPGENGTEIDYSSVHLVLTATSENGNELYSNTIDTSGKFEHDFNFYFKPDRNSNKNENNSL